MPAPAAAQQDLAASAPAPPPLPAATGVDARASTSVHTSGELATAGSSAPTPAPAAASAPAFGAARERDAHHDRVLIAPTAETHPRGSFYVTSYEIVLLQLGYAVTDSTQLSLTLTPPLGAARIVPADISLKTVLLREPHVTVAALASASGVLGLEEFSGFLGRAGAVATFCPDALQCRLSFSMSSDVALAGPATLLMSGAGVSFRAGRIVSLLAELDTLIPLAAAAGQANGILGGVGVRLSGRAWGVDLAVLKAGKAHADPSGLLPFLAVTYRYLP